MKTLSLSLVSLFLFAQAGNADESYLGRAPDRGIIITAKPNTPVSKAGDKFTIRGTIKVLGKVHDEKDKKGKDDGLLEEFKKQGIDIVATFPSSAIDVTAGLILKSISNREVEYTYQSQNNIVASDLNQFSIKVFNNNKSDKELLKKLLSI